MDRSEKTLRNDSASGMSSLWPRIGEHQMENINGTGWKKRLNRAGDIATQDPGVSQPAHCNFAAGTARSSQQTLNPKKILLRIRRRRRRQKQSIATTKIDLQRRGPTEQFVQIQRRQ